MLILHSGDYILAVKFLAFWKLRRRSWGPIHCWSPNLKVGEPVFPGPYGCCTVHLCVRRRCATFLRFLNCRQMLGLTYLLTLQGPRTERQTRSTCNWNVSLSAAAQQRDARHYETDGRLRWMSLASSRLFQKLASPSSRCRRLSNWSIVETTTTAIRPPRHVTRWRHTNSCILLLPVVLRAGPPSRYSIRFEPLPLLFSTKSATAMAALWRICVRENLAGIVRWSLVNTGLTSWTCVLLFEIFCSSFFLFKF